MKSIIKESYLLSVIITAILVSLWLLCPLGLAESTSAPNSNTEDEPSEIGAIIAIVMIVALIGAVFGNRFWLSIFLIGCVLELVFGYQYIIVVLIIVFVLIPMGGVAFISSLFDKK